MRWCRFSMTGSVVKLSFAKWKKTVSSLAIVSAFCILTSSGALSAGAIDYNNVEYLSDSATMAILGTGGNNISAFYLALDDSYKPCTFEPVNANLTFGASNVYGYAINYWTARDCIVYRCSVPSDVKYGSFSAKQYFIPFNCHFGNEPEKNKEKSRNHIHVILLSE